MLVMLMTIVVHVSILLVLGGGYCQKIHDVDVVDTDDVGRHGAPCTVVKGQGEGVVRTPSRFSFSRHPPFPSRAFFTFGTVPRLNIRNPTWVHKEDLFTF